MKVKEKNHSHDSTDLILEEIQEVGIQAVEIQKVEIHQKYQKK